jgi:Dehydrogenases with different specificities (related to short-chain alcohol dehydrogenases)
MTARLDGRVALVSGSGRGIGREIALKLASEGARIVVNDLDADPAAQTAEMIRDMGGEAAVCAGSVTEDGFAQRFVDTGVNAFGGLDIIVNNAGYTWDSVVQKMTDEQWHAIIDVHLTAPFQILRAAAPVFRDKARAEAEAGQEVFRKVVNISSIAGTGGNAGQINYSAAKAGIIGLTRTMAKEWGRYKVNVNAVAFGPIRTRLTEGSAKGDSTIQG